MCTLNKVVGSVDVLDARPIGLLFLWRNTMMGIQLYKVMHTSSRVTGGSGQMADWRPGWSGH